MTTPPTAPQPVSARPTGFVGTRMVAAQPETINAQMAAAEPGDILVVPAGSHLPDLVVPPRKEGDWITLMTAGESALPTDRTPGPADLDKLISAPTLSAGAGSGGWRFVGLEVVRDPAASMVYQLVVLQDAQRLAFDRCYVHGRDGQPTRRGFMANCADLSIVKCRVDRIHEPGADAQAICGWDATARVLVEDCDLAAATENIMFGGADSASVERQPCDITVRRCRLSKDPAWLNVYPQKNLFELKCALRVLVEDCEFDGGAFQGAAFVMTPRNQGGAAPWSCVHDALFRNITVRNVGELIAFQTIDNGRTSGTLARIAFRNINAPSVSRQGFHIGGEVPMEDLELSHCTVLPTAYYPLNVEAPLGFFVRLKFTDNLFGFGAYGPNSLLKADALTDADSVVAGNGLVNAGDVGDGQGVQRNQQSAMDPARFISIPSLAEVANYPTMGYHPEEETMPPTDAERVAAAEARVSALEEWKTVAQQEQAGLSERLTALEARIAALEAWRATFPA